MIRPTMRDDTAALICLAVAIVISVDGGRTHIRRNKAGKRRSTR